MVFDPRVRNFVLSGFETCIYSRILSICTLNLNALWINGRKGYALKLVLSMLATWLVIVSESNIKRW
jgi:hypothetical protein